MKEKNDYELMQLVKENYRPALEEIYERYIKLIYSFTFKFFQGDEDKTKEVVQLIFLKLWTTKSMYNPSKGDFVNWILTITRNICIDYVRKENKELMYRNFHNIYDSEKHMHITDSENQIEKRLHSVEIQKAKQNLSIPQKRLIDLLYWKGYSLSEIAKMEGEPLGTTKSRLHQSLKRLKRYLE
ncbi:RNA polymerase [Bacillus cereus]|uniref:RNA polymerase n=1 Tax=Bacillus cereus TaxID=1396 RepID=A0A2B2GG62_BACCE|nr:MULTISPECIES: sigma-70 family RNA polymerase sigma factor [Bacillus cereus group]MDR4984347.1 sigma-70 family RNA polymerase sigma factor [Bacillus cereus]MEA1010625.1 sigma-70 family RNA polymerase sigma factor [Bacillus cereus]PES99583.1 RNA polymerase [Bacillus cereus]PFP80105.1 RNA polymerase [Bacillus cereus]PGT19634.1 RNA polymerase [Bacillus cereus]